MAFSESRSNCFGSSSSEVFGKCQQNQFMKQGLVSQYFSHL
jgi:hypothetical protein